MILVINEWIFHDLLCANGRAAFEGTARFVEELYWSNDIVVIPDGDRWKRKAVELESASNSLQRRVCQLFLGLFYDSTRSVRLPPGDQLPETQGLYDWVPDDDVYLVEACDRSGAHLLITTDQELFDKVTEFGEVECKMRDDFVSGYGLSTPGF